jgi:ribosome-binding ATPase
VTHVSGSIDPKNDIEIINAELILADLETINKRMQENIRKARS